MSTFFPTAIPATVWISLEPKEYLIVYLVGAAGLTVAVLSFGATRLTDRQAVGLVIATLAVMHGASGLLNVLYAAQTGWTTVLAVNTSARLAAVTVLLVALASGCAPNSPDVGHQPIVHLGHVLLVPGEFLAHQLLLVEDAHR